MAVYEKFEDLPVWKLAKDLTVRMYQITKDQKFRRDYALVDLIRRTSISVSSNIAPCRWRDFQLFFRFFALRAQNDRCGKLVWRITLSYYTLSC
jgi:four helix bundle protein